MALMEAVVTGRGFCVKKVKGPSPIPRRRRALALPKHPSMSVNASVSTVISTDNETLVK